ncbi:MAG: DUF3786 domain-containing protein [Bacillota bacterium]
MINLEPALHSALTAYAGGAPAEMALASGARFELSEGFFVLPFLGTAHRLGFPDGDCHPPLADQARILCLHYLTGAPLTGGPLTGGPLTGAPLTGRLIAFRELPGGDIYTGPFAKRILKPLVDSFARRPEALSRAAARLGGGLEKFGDMAVKVPVFPRVPITYVLWLGDEEFGPNGTVLFDESASAYLSTEDLIVAAGEALMKLRAIADAEQGASSH